MDPNITNETLKELIKSDAKLISNETMQQILSMTPTEIIDEEFFMDIELVLRTFLNVFSRI